MRGKMVIWKVVGEIDGGVVWEVIWATAEAGREL